MRVVVVVLMLLTPLAACGSDADSDSNDPDALTAEQEALVEELQEVATDDEDALEEDSRRDSRRPPSGRLRPPAPPSPSISHPVTS